MIYLHGGLPRTGTSSLQSALFEHRERLADAGIIYPERWIGIGGVAHHKLYHLILSSAESESALDDLKRFLGEHSDRTVLLSTESMTTFLQYKGHVVPLLGFLDAVKEVTTVRCVWCLRRFDEMMSSLYVLALWHGFDPPTGAEALARGRQMEYVLPGLREIEQVVGGEITYVKYSPVGTHIDGLLRTFEIPVDVAADIRRQLDRGPRHNASLSQKAAAAMVGREALSARAGVDIDKAALRAALEPGKIVFEGDRRCELVDESVRRTLHERALGIAREHGLSEYVEFFGNTEVAAGSSTPLAPETLTDDDLQRLIAHLPPTPAESPVENARR
jgi:hypothetical protein